MNLPATLFLFLVLTTNLYAQDLFLPISTPSQNARFHYEQGMLRAYNADFSGFDASMERALRADSTLFMAWYQQAIFARYFGNQENFARFSEKALTHTGEKNPAEQRLRGILAKLSDDPAAYVGDDFAEIAAMYPWVLEAQSAVSFYERRQKNHEKAIAAASRSVQLRPDFGPGYNTLAYAYLAAGKLDHAQAAMEKYRSLQPDDPNPYDSLGDLWMEAREYKKAAENYFLAYKKDPNWIAGKEKAEEALRVLESSKN